MVLVDNKMVLKFSATDMRCSACVCSLLHSYLWLLHCIYLLGLGCKNRMKDTGDLCLSMVLELSGLPVAYAIQDLVGCILSQTNWFEFRRGYWWLVAMVMWSGRGSPRVACPSSHSRWHSWKQCYHRGSLTVACSSGHSRWHGRW